MSHQPVSGVLVLDKPEGSTSFEVVKRIRKALQVKKAGHTGTLDPIATGVLVVCLGRATKLVPFLQAGAKEYSGQILLGLATETGDITGRATEKRVAPRLSLEEVQDAAFEFIGMIEQVPPAYSAIKVNGRPAYRLARQGARIPVRVRRVTVHDLEITDINGPILSFQTRVSKGTYIRSLASELGRRLGTAACLKSLRRTAAEPFTVDQALPLNQAVRMAEEGVLTEKLVTLEQALAFLPQVSVSNKKVQWVANGRPLPVQDVEGFNQRPGPVRIQNPTLGLLAVYEYNSPTREGGLVEYLTPLKVFASCK